MERKRSPEHRHRVDPGNPRKQERAVEVETIMSELVDAIEKQTAAIENMNALLHNDLQELKHLLSLTPIYHMPYHLSQENFGGQNQGVVFGHNTNLQRQRSKERPRFVPKGQSVTCVRCEYQWTPQSRYPQKCPNCRSPWWYPPKWRWQKNSDSKNGS